LERPRATRTPFWPWLLVIVGAIAAVGLAAHMYTAYATLDHINQADKINVGNALLQFQDVATNGPRVGANVDSASRATYTRALNQFALDGTGVLLSISLVVAGAFICLNLNQ